MDDNLNLDMVNSKFEIQDLGMAADKLPGYSPGVFSDIYAMFQKSEFATAFAGGSVAKLGIGDVIEAGTINERPQVGMLVDFDMLEKWLTLCRSGYVQVGDNLVIVDAWIANFKPMISNV